MSTPTAAVAPLDVARIRRTLTELRAHLSEAVALLEGLYAERAWVALGLPSWEALCSQELPELGRLLDAAQRRAVVVGLRAGGASLRAAAAPVGVSAATAKTWCDDAGVQLASVTSLDGRTRPGGAAPGARRRRVPLTGRIVATLTAAGPEGLTVREVAERVKATRVEVAPALHRLTVAGRINYARPERRGQFGRYVAGTVTA